MNVYFDTSAIVKFYVTEDNSEQARSYLEQSSIALTSQIAYAQTHAALTKLVRTDHLTDQQCERCLNDFSADWNRYVVMDVDDRVASRAGHWASKYGLRGFDAVHLSTVVEFQEAFEDPVHVLTYVQSMNESADEIGLPILK